MKRFFKTLSISIAILAGSAIACTILLWLVYLLPTDIMREHVSESVLMQVWEGDYYRWIPKDATSIYGEYHVRLSRA